MVSHDIKIVFKKLLKECLEELQEKQESKEINTDESRINQKQACQFLGISQTTIIDWKRKGLIPFHQIPNTRKIYYLKSELRSAAEKMQKGGFNG